MSYGYISELIFCYLKCLYSEMWNNIIIYEKCFPVAHCQETNNNIQVTNYTSKMIVSKQNVFHIKTFSLSPTLNTYLTFSRYISLIQNIPKMYHNKGLFSKFALIFCKVYWLIMRNIKHFYRVVYILLNFESIWYHIAIKFRII
jgi:hypothetical protein